MKLSRSEFIVLREVLKSDKKGRSYNELLKMLKDRLSNQGLSDALKGLQMKSLIYRDFMSSKAKGSHAVYKSTAASFGAMYANDLGEFLVSSDTSMTHVSLPPLPFATSCFYPSVTLVSIAEESFTVLKENKEFGTELHAVAQHIVSAWLKHRQKSYNEQSLKAASEYEEALATYLRLFRCQMKRWTPNAINKLKPSHYDYLDPLDRVESAGNIDWPLTKYHITAEELQKRREKNFPQADDDLGKTSAEDLRRLKRVVYDKEKKRAYEGYLKSLIPPKTVLLMDFGISRETARKSLTGEMESRDCASGEPESFAGIISRSAFAEAKREHGRKEPERTPEPNHDEPKDDVQPAKNPKWIF